MTQKTYTTNTHKPSDEFDWSRYFNDKQPPTSSDHANISSLEKRIREHLKEDRFEISLVLTKTMRALLKQTPIPSNPSILELGAATGFLTRWLLDKYDGKGLLVDNNESAKQQFINLKANDHYEIDYLQKDFFNLDLNSKFDIVGSFGLIEHFADKADVMQTHAKFVKPGGYLIILAPLDTRLSRVYWEVHQELNLGYRELLSEKAFKAIFEHCPDFKLLATEKSYGYAYDFIAGIAHYQKDQPC